MKTTFLQSLFITFIVSFNASSQTESHNYISVKTMRDSTGASYNETIRYYDALGQHEETVAVGITPSGNSIVNYIGRDAKGRVTESFLPTIGANGPEYIPRAQALISAMTTYDGDTSPFVKTVYENNPLDRPEKVYGAGATWHNFDKYVKTSRMCNIEGDQVLDCRLYKVSDTRLMKSTDIEIEHAGSYKSGTLYVTRTDDEDGITLLVFTDLQGKKILERRRNGDKLNSDTYFIYDDYDMLTAVLSPKLSEKLKGNKQWSLHKSEDMKDLATLYMYDSRGYCRAKKMPGCDWIYYGNDQAGRPVFMQDGLLREQGLWHFSMPDHLGRTLITGLCFVYSLGNFIANPPHDFIFRMIPDGNGGYSYDFEGITKGSDDFYIVSLLTGDLYDYYPDMNDNYASHLKFMKEDGFDNMCETAAKGQITFSGSQILDTETIYNANKFLYTAHYYDDMGRLLQTRADNHLGGVDTSTFGYDFNGNITRKHVKSTVVTGGTESVVTDNLYRFVYDHADRLAAIYLSSDGAAETLLQSNEYDELGRLHASSMPGDAGTVHYTHNLRGWTTSINDNRSFSQTIRYADQPISDDPDVKPRYNGTVCEITWSAGNGVDNPLHTIDRTYSFEYYPDGALHYASYNDQIMEDRFSSAYDYDLNGNITHVRRIGPIQYMSGYPGMARYEYIDQIDIEHKGNQVINAYDSEYLTHTYETMEFVNTEIHPQEYLYDQNGNLIYDLNKGISKIEYTIFNKPRKITFADGHIIRHTYDASGKKLRTTYFYNHPAVAGTSLSAESVASVDDDPEINLMSTATETATLSTKDYVSDCVLTDGVVDHILTPVGYLKDGSHHAFVKDYLGNVRAVIREDGEIIETNHYYPFGALITDPLEAGSKKQPYKFGGKELDRENRLDMYDFHARQYDPLLCRFNSIDPMTEKYPWLSPYVYAMNNPINAIDTDGRLVLFVNGMHSGDGGSPEYWEGTDNRIMNIVNDHNSMYFDGSIGGTSSILSQHSNLSESRRFVAGYSEGQKVASEIFHNLLDDETIKIVTHSMGGAYGKGLAAALIMYNNSLPSDKKRNRPIEFELDLAPYQPEKQTAISGVQTYVIQHKYDLIANTGDLSDATKQHTTRDHWLHKFNRIMTYFQPHLNWYSTIRITIQEHSVANFSDQEIKYILEEYDIK